MIRFFKSLFGSKKAVEPEVPYKVEAPAVEVAPAPAPVAVEVAPVVETAAKPKKAKAKAPAAKKPRAPRKPKQSK